MTTAEAISFFAKIGWKVDKVGRGKYRVWEIGGEIKECWRKGFHPFWSGRDLVRYANSMRNKDNTKKLTREEENSKNRSATRDLIKKKEFDKIPKEGKVKEGNPWNWD